MLLSLAKTYSLLEDHQKAIEFYQQSLVITRELGDRQGEVKVLLSLAKTYSLLEDHQKAIEFYQKSLVITRELGDRQGEAKVLSSLGNVYRDLKQYPKAIEFYQQSLQISKDIGDKFLGIEVQRNLDELKKREQSKYYILIFIVGLVVSIFWLFRRYPHLIVLLKKRNEFSKEDKLILFKKIFEDLHQTNRASLSNLLKTEGQRRLILNQFHQDYNFLNLIFVSDIAKIEVSEKERMNAFKKIWKSLNGALNQNDMEVFRPNADKLTRLFCESLGFKTLDISETLGQLYGRMIDASNPAFQLNIRSFFPLIYACKTTFNEEDALRIHGLLNQFEIYADFFALLVVFDNYQEIRQQVRESPFKNNFIVLKHDQLWDILAAKSPIQQLTNCILEQIDLVAISPYTVSGPVKETMFFGRAEEEKILLQNIARNDYALLANRKTGKTSLLNRIYPRLKSIPNYQVFYCDLQTVNNYDLFYQELALSYPEFEEKIAKFSELSPSSFRKLISNIKQRNRNRQIIFIFDEVDEILAYDIQEKEQLFKTFRSLSQRENIRFIFSGTTTLVKRMRHPDSPLFNFCSPIKIGILEEKASQELVRVPMGTLGVKFENESAIIQRIIDLTAQHPNIIQYICDALIRKINEKQERTITEQDLDIVVTSQEFYEYFESLIWGQSTALEKLIVNAMWSYPEFTESEVIEEFKLRGIPSQGVKASLEILLTYSTLSKKNDKYFFTFREFAKLMEERSDIQALAEHYQREVGGSVS
ncbi:MAG: tetratricopeptide repeat protein [Xenococcus sp. MO_188.B8]|nr:tetratricopeptide repeat protein [Xenococcus sp. MO_188.B8]